MGGQVGRVRRPLVDPGYRLEGGSRRDRIKLLGNAVCPPVMEAIVSGLAGGLRREMPLAAE